MVDNATYGGAPAIQSSPDLRGGSNGPVATSACASHDEMPRACVAIAAQPMTPTAPLLTVNNSVVKFKVDNDNSGENCSDGLIAVGLERRCQKDAL